MQEVYSFSEEGFKTSKNTVSLLKHEVFFLEGPGSLDASELSRDWMKSQSDDDKHLQVSIQLTRYGKLKSGTSAPTVLYGSLYILGNWRSLSRALAALLILYPLVVLVLGKGTGWRPALGSQAQGLPHHAVPSSHPPQDTSPARPAPLCAGPTAAGTGGSGGFGWLHEERWEAKPASTLGCFSRGELIAEKSNSKRHPSREYEWEMKGRSHVPACVITHDYREER